jgi:hypothetical protein
MPRLHWRNVSRPENGASVIQTQVTDHKKTQADELTPISWTVESGG